MKKLFVLILSALILLSLASCEKDSEKETTSETESAKQSDTVQTDESGGVLIDISNETETDSVTDDAFSIGELLNELGLGVDEDWEGIELPEIPLD